MYSAITYSTVNYFSLRIGLMATVIGDTSKEVSIKQLWDVGSYESNDPSNKWDDLPDGCATTFTMDVTSVGGDQRTLRVYSTRGGIWEVRQDSMATNHTWSMWSEIYSGGVQMSGCCCCCSCGGGSGSGGGNTGGSMPIVLSVNEKTGHVFLMAKDIQTNRGYTLQDFIDSVTAPEPAVAEMVASEVLHGLANTANVYNSFGLTEAPTKIFK